MVSLVYEKGRGSKRAYQLSLAGGKSKCNVSKHCHIEAVEVNYHPLALGFQ